MPALHIWMNGEHVGEWGTSKSRAPYFRYADSWRESANFRSLSLALPWPHTLEIRGPQVDYYFDNLLPDSADIRRRLHEKFGVSSSTVFDLLAAIGRDCIGAVQLLPPGEEPVGWDRVVAEPLSPKRVAVVLRNLTSTRLLGAGDDSEFRLSLAGANEKTALLKMGGRWYQPRGSTPTTHILKLPIGRIGPFDADLTHSVENEWLCARVLRGLGLPVAACDINEFDGQRVLVVQRFDRRWFGASHGELSKRRFKPAKGIWIARLPQEDFCQATGRPPTQKYESDGGPSIQSCLDVLANSEHPADDRDQFLLSQFAFWIMAAIDGHGKNFSIHHRAGGAYQLTPLYDVISAWPIIGNGRNKLPLQRVKMAMAIRGNGTHYRLLEILPRHWEALAKKAGGPQLWETMQAMARNAPKVIVSLERELPKGFPEYIYDAIRLGIKRQSAQIESASH